MIILCLIAFFFFGGIAAIILSSNGWEYGFFQIWTIVLSGIFLLIGIACLYPLLNIKKHVRLNNHPEEYKGEKVARDRRRVYNFFFFIVFIFILGLNYQVISNQIHSPKINENTLKTFKAKLSRDIDYHRATRGSSSLSLFIEGKDSLEFEIPYPSFNQHIANELYQGDSIQLTILADDYEKWISKTMAFEFNDLHVNYGNIVLYGIQNSNFIFWDIEEFQNKMNQDKIINFWIAFVIDSILVILFLFKSFRKPKGNS